MEYNTHHSVLVPRLYREDLETQIGVEVHCCSVWQVDELWRKEVSVHPDDQIGWLTSPSRSIANCRLKLKLTIVSINYRNESAPFTNGL